MIQLGNCELARRSLEPAMADPDNCLVLVDPARRHVPQAGSDPLSGLSHWELHSFAEPRTRNLARRPRALRTCLVAAFAQPP
jgi:hypothetical protein